MLRRYLIPASLLILGLIAGFMVSRHYSQGRMRREVTALKSLYHKYHSPAVSASLNLRQNEFITDTEPDTSSLPTDCSDDPAEWLKWRDDQIAALLTPTYAGPNNEKMIERTHVIEVSATSFNRLDACMKAKPELFASGTDLAKNVEPFYRFIRANQWMALKDSQGNDTNQFGFKISDREYWDYAKEYVEFPSLMRDQTFLKAMANPDGYMRAMHLIEAFNAGQPEANRWIVLPFRAQFITTVGSDPQAPKPTATYGRMLVRVPNVPAADGGTIDKWILWGILTPDMDQTTSAPNVSIFSVHRDASSHAITYMMDFWRQPNAAGDIELTPIVLREGKDPSHNCYDCHKMAVLPFHPAEQYKFDSSGKLITDTHPDLTILDGLNDTAAGYGPPDFGVMDVNDYGPGLAPARQRSDDYMKQCVGDDTLSVTSIQKIRSAMNCSMCHNNSSDGLGSLNYLQALRNKRDVTAFLAKKSMIATFIESEFMPPHKQLSALERTALAGCLQKEYYDPNTKTGVLIDWLKGKLPN